MYIDLRLLTGQPWEIAALQKVFEGSPGCAERLLGHSAGAEEAQRLFHALPPGITNDNKYVYGVMADGLDMVGCADLIRGWPILSTALIGLLFLDEEHQGQRLGQSMYHVVEAKVRCWPEIDMLRLPVLRSNAAMLPFWRHLGFRETGEVAPHIYASIFSESIILTKPLRDDNHPPDPAS